MIDFVKINDKYKKYLAIKNDILISTAGTCGRVIKLSFDKGYHAHHMPRFIDIQINKDYLYYYILSAFDPEYIKNNTHGSVLGHLKMETILNTIIKVPTPSTMKKYNLEKLFNEVDQIKERLETTKKEHEKEVNLLMKPFENKTQDKTQIKSEKLSDSDDEDLDDYSDDESSEEEKIPLKKTTKGIPQKQSKN
jgi:restriction endonuclease S subunit